MSIPEREQGPTEPSRARRRLREVHNWRSRRSAAVVLPLPAAPRISMNPCIASVNIMSCSGVGLTLWSVRK